LRLLTLTLLAVLAIGLLIAATPTETTPVPQTRIVVKTKLVEKRYLGLTARAWASRNWQTTIALKRTRRVLLSKPSVVEAINLACATYGNCETLWRKANCETGGTFNPLADNPTSDASGLFQFMPSTFASTPYARLSIWSPYANALAAGWMHEHGRGGEWVCR